MITAHTSKTISVLKFSPFWRRKIRLIEGNAKCRHLNKFTSKGTFRHVFICLRPRTRGDIWRWASFVLALSGHSVFKINLFTVSKKWERVKIVKVSYNLVLLFINCNARLLLIILH